MPRNDDDTRGYLITFEGSEGSGKSTQIGRIADRFTDAGYEVVVTREPGGTKIGEEIRHILKHADAGVGMFPETELLLFAASRAQLVREVIEPALTAGKIVLCDRFMDSTTVYQGVGRKIQSGPVHMINTFAVGDVVPDVTVVIDVPAEVGFERLRHRVTDLPDRMEAENIEFYRNVREGYLMLAKALPERFVIVDGCEEIEAVEETLWKALRRRVI
jgi:dTMP kinase